MIRILITGAHGLVGSRIAELLKYHHNVLSPRKSQLDVRSIKSVSQYFSIHKPHVIIHAAAFTQALEAEHERLDRKGECWQINVVGTKNISRAAKKVGAYVIFISTGSVFRSTKTHPGPFSENAPVTNLRDLSWYGWTKSQAEAYIDGSVVRIAHPVKAGESDTKDYIHTIVYLHKANKLYPLYTDQFIQLTFIDDLVPVFEKLIANREKGIFHVTSPDTVTPYNLAQYLLHRPGNIKAAHMQNSPFRTDQNCILEVSKTQKRLGLHFRPWQQVVEMIR